MLVKYSANAFYVALMVHKMDLQNIWKMYKDINKFKKSYQPCAYIIKKDDGAIIVDTAIILSRWEWCYSNLLNV